jgi:tetratricopeptide (TPR) repeat protein
VQDRPAPTYRAPAAPRRVARAAALLLLAIAAAFATVPPPAAAQQPVPREVQSLLAQQKWPEALAAIDRVLKLRPNDTELLMERGAVLSALGRQDEALAAFRRVIALQPQRAAAHNNLAVTLAATGRHDEARAALQRAIRLQPGYATAHENLGDLHAHQAAESYRRALEADAGLRSARIKLDRAQDLLALSGVAPPAGAATPAQAPPGTGTPAQAGAGTGAPAPAQAQAPAGTGAAGPAPPPAPPPAAAPATARATAAPGASAAAATAAGASAEVEAAVRAWARAWSARDVAGYLGAYAPEFKGAAADPQAWRQERAARIEAATSITVGLSGLRVQVDGEQAEASFQQSFDSSVPGSRARTGKTLKLRRVQGRWLIEQEIRN